MIVVAICYTYDGSCYKKDKHGIYKSMEIQVCVVGMIIALLYIESYQMILENKVRRN